MWCQWGFKVEKSPSELLEEKTLNKTHFALSLVLQTSKAGTTPQGSASLSIATTSTRTPQMEELSPSLGRWSGPDGPHDEPSARRSPTVIAARELLATPPRVPKLRLGAAAAPPLPALPLRATPSGPARTPQAQLDLSDSPKSGVFRAATMTQAGGLRVTLQSSPPPAQGGHFLGDDNVSALGTGAVSDDHLGQPELSSPSSPQDSNSDRYGRLREEAAREGMRMLQEERERNREMNELLKTRCSDLEEELTQTREELRSTRDRLGKKVLYRHSALYSVAGAKLRFVLKEQFKNIIIVILVEVVFITYTPTCCKG